VFATGGDGFAVVFSDVGAALDAAVEMQAVSVDTGLLVRAGLHIGSAVERDDDFFGPAVNRTARLMAVGHGGQVLFSEAAAAVARSCLPDGVTLVDLGVHRLRDLRVPEHVWELHVSGRSRSSPPLRTEGVVLTNLPMVDPLVGRDRDVAMVVELLQTQRLVTIVGPAGVGKSRLALSVAQDVAGEWADGTWLVELAALSDPSALIGFLAGILPLPALPANAAELVDRIGGRQMLVVLDNCEHLIEDVASLVSQLVAGCPRVRVLCTSQELLSIDREHAWPLSPLSEKAAVELFYERARAIRPSWSTIPKPSRRSGSISTDCRWPSSWPRRGSPRSVPPRSRPVGMIASGCCRWDRVDSILATAPSGPWSTGATSC